MYRFDGTDSNGNMKKRVAAEAPDKSIHIFDEENSLLSATTMFPKFYKLNGKIFIKPDPDYNAHPGVGNDHAYYKLGDSSVTSIAPESGDKGVIVYSAPPVIDEDTDEWILVEYENIAIFYAASLDNIRLAQSYRDLCKVELDKIVSTSSGPLKSYQDAVASLSTPNFSFSDTVPSSFAINSSLPSDFDISGINLPSVFSSPSSIPSFSITKSLQSSFSFSETFPTFSFSYSLPTGMNITKSLPSELSLTKSLPTSLVVESTLPSDFSMGSLTLPTYSFDGALPSGIAVSSTLPSDFSISSSLPSSITVSSELPSGFSPDANHALSTTDFSLNSSLPSFKLLSG